jgi:hypothetical protein
MFHPFWGTTPVASRATGAVVGGGGCRFGGDLVRHGVAACTGAARRVRAGAGRSGAESGRWWRRWRWKSGAESAPVVFVVFVVG